MSWQNNGWQMRLPLIVSPNISDDFNRSLGFKKKCKSRHYFQSNTKIIKMVSKITIYSLLPNKNQKLFYYYVLLKSTSNIEAYEVDFSNSLI